MILYFSGTGNSRYVAKKIATKAKDEVVSIQEMLGENKTTLHSDRPFVFSLPTYAWRIPRFVEKWIRNTSFTGNRHVYFILTCGDHTFSAKDFVEKLCLDKNWSLMGFSEIVMPENYIAMFPTPSAEEAKSIIQQSHAKIDKVASRIAKDEALPFFPSSKKFYSYVVNPIFYRFFVHDRGFYTTDACIQCGQCVALCPLHNIKLEGKQVTWNGNCTHCMACICGCPTKAIEYKKKSHGKPRYFLTEPTES